MPVLRPADARPDQTPNIFAARRGVLAAPLSGSGGADSRRRERPTGFFGAAASAPAIEVHTLKPERPLSRFRLRFGPGRMARVAAATLLFGALGCGVLLSDRAASPRPEPAPRLGGGPAPTWPTARDGIPRPRGAVGVGARTARPTERDPLTGDSSRRRTAAGRRARARRTPPTGRRAARNTAPNGASAPAAPPPAGPLQPTVPTPPPAPTPTPVGPPADPRPAPVAPGSPPEFM
jgi:hypothetical protein